MKGTIFDISNRVAVITGGSKGLGQHFTMHLAEAGADVVIVSRHLDEAETVAGEVRKKGVRALAVRADITKASECEEIMKKTVGAFGRLDILVNNAGMIERGPLLEFSEDQYAGVFDTDVKGIYFCSRFAAREMMKQKRGRIINITSVGAKIAIPMMGLYCAAKAGADHLTKACALEWGQYGITVNAIGPYSTRTDINRAYLAVKSNYEAMVSRTALKRIGEPEDLKGLLLLLASDASSFITGQCFYVDGGATAGWAFEFVAV